MVTLKRIFPSIRCYLVDSINESVLSGRLASVFLFSLFSCFVKMEKKAKMEFRRTENEYNLKSIKFLLLTITTMFIIIAFLMIVLGISVFGHYHSFEYLEASAKSTRIFTPSIVVVLLGIVLLVVTSFGFFGSLKESTCLVNMYAFILFLVFILELVVVCISFSLSSTQLLSYIEVPVQYYTTDAEVQAEMDMLQKTLNCCGSDSYLDYVGQEFTSNHTTAVASTTVDGDSLTVILPISCCAQYGNAICTRVRGSGCKAALVDLVIQNASILGVLGVSVMFIQVLGIIFALLLARCIRKIKSERALMKWKICEQMILARKLQAEECKDQPQSVYIQPSESSRA